MRTDAFDFELPESAIALRPATPRDSARLLVVRPGTEAPLADGTVRDLVSLLRQGDALVFNDTRVIPAALEGQRLRGETSARVAFNLLRRLDLNRWRALARPQKRLKVGDDVRFALRGSETALAARVEEHLPGGEVTLAFDRGAADLDRAIAEAGAMPLPPYIALKRKPDDADRDSYQTVYARREGAVAAPTAGLHFTEALLADLDRAGISRHFVTLHVGAGTFLPVKVEDTENHVMHAEWGEVSAETADALNKVRSNGGRVVAVGTTSLRLLESAAQSGAIAPFAGDTAIFISPGYRFRAVDLLMTNFHLPKSTLFMLVAAFSGLDTMQSAYAHAIATGYRFYSYGDASLLNPLVPTPPPNARTETP